MYFWTISQWLLLLLLSRFSRVQLCATPQTAAHWAPPSLGFSRQEHWSGLPFYSPMHERGKWKWSRSVSPTLSDPMDCSQPDSSIHRSFQAKVLEWDAIDYSLFLALVKYFLHLLNPCLHSAYPCFHFVIKLLGHLYYHYLELFFGKTPYLFLFCLVWWVFYHVHSLDDYFSVSSFV